MYVLNYKLQLVINIIKKTYARFCCVDASNASPVRPRTKTCLNIQILSLFVISVDSTNFKPHNLTAHMAYYPDFPNHLTQSQTSGLASRFSTLTSQKQLIINIKL